MSIKSSEVEKLAAKRSVSPFVVMKEKVGYESDVKGFFCCENCLNRLDTRRGMFCRVIGYDPSDPEAQIEGFGKCRHHKHGRMTTLEDDNGK
jgi:hypothetical protein